jgi:recombinational DNA repair protein RecT
MKKNERCFKNVLPKHLNQERWAWLVVNSIRQTPALAGVKPMSFINAVMLASNLGLEIRKNSCYLIPYKDECQLIVDYHGKMELARRAGVGAVHVELVRDGDDFEYGFNSDGLNFRWVPKQDVGEVIAGFCSSRVNGGHQVNVMYLSEIEAIRKRVRAGCAVPFEKFGKTYPGLTLADIRAKDVASMGFKDPYRQPWVTDWDRMARKTIIHRASNDWPMSAALLTSQEIDTAADMGQAMPIAEGMEGVVLDIDPADNLPMVDGGGDTFDEQRETLQRVGAAELRKGPPVGRDQANRITAAARGSHERLQAALTAHGCATIAEVRQSQFDSIMAMLEAE